MKKKIIIITTIVVLPILTFVAGAYGATWIFSMLLDPYSESAADAVTTYAALAVLQDGDAEEAIYRLEQKLNGSLIGLSTLDQMKDGEEKEKLQRLLGKIRTYREKYPYSSENESIDRTVNKALSYGITN